MVCFFLLVFLEQGPDILVRLVNLLPLLRSRQHDLTRRENKQHELRLRHPEDQAREHFWLVSRKLVRVFAKRLQFYQEAHVVRSDDVLNRKAAQSHVLNSNLHYGLRVLFAGRFGHFFGLGPSADHASRGKNQRCGLRVPYPHDRSCKSFWFVLHVIAVHCDVLQIDLAIKGGGRYYILELGQVWLQLVRHHEQLRVVVHVVRWRHHPLDA